MSDPDEHRAAIAALVYAYAERLDAGDLAGVAALFADATLRGGRSGRAPRGRDAVLALFRGTVRLYDDLPCTKHVITNLVVTLDGDRASSRCAFTVLQARPGLPLQAILAGRYHDRWQRHGGSWRFAERLVLADHLGELSRHTLPG
ncbi:MAG: nuclear transport factor 2 family protein [Deltaproteobacteria bacterium]|nr:nuclear transport factor 2 family protein [Deltaproteobacteria bacterium]